MRAGKVRGALLLLPVVLLLAPTWTVVLQVSAEGAGESLADVSVCLEQIQKLQSSEIFFLGNNSVVIAFNGTLYGANATVYVVDDPEAELDSGPAGNETAAKAP
eukprot:scaffold648434_cov45-Prasinocladus_malaysianus.AAC.1